MSPEALWERFKNALPAGTDRMWDLRESGTIAILFRSFAEAVCAEYADAEARRRGRGE